MPKKYQVITADDTIQMGIRTTAMIAQGYMPVGSIICGTREETIQHTIKGATTVQKTYLRQSFWYAPNVDSAFEDCIKQYNLLSQVVEDANGHHQAKSVRCNPMIDRDIIDVIEAHLRGDEQ